MAMTEATAVALLEDRGWGDVVVERPGRKFYRVRGTYAGQAHSAVRESLDELIGDMHRAAVPPPEAIIIERVVDRIVEVAAPAPPPSQWLQSKLLDNERTDAAKRRLLQRYTALEQKVEYRSASDDEYREHAELFDNLLELRAR